MSAMTDATPYTVPQEPGRWRAIILAALVHLGLLTFLWIGVRWQNEAPTTIEAEVWSPQPREAAPLPEPTAAPEKEPEPAPVVKEVPREVPKPEVKEPPVEKPDIALEREKKRKALEKKRQEEEQAKLKQKAEQERLAKLKKEQEERLAKKKAEDERLAKLEADKQRLEKEKADKAKKTADAKRKQEADEKLAAKARAEEMRRLTGATGTGGSGDASKSQGGRADSGYAGRVAAKIKSNIVFSVPEGMTDNPPVEYEVNLLPDGSIAGIKKIKSSGMPGFDEAVRRAIEKSQPYPRDKSGSVPSSFIGSHRPKD